MEIRDYLTKTIFPRVQADGGWLEWVDGNENEIVLRARGECANCECFSRCLDWIRQRVKEDLQKEIQIHVEKKPFVWRT